MKMSKAAMTRHRVSWEPHWPSASRTKLDGLHETDTAIMDPTPQAMVSATVALQRIQDFRVASMSRVKSRSIRAATEPFAKAKERIRNICAANVAWNYN